MESSLFLFLAGKVFFLEITNNNNNNNNNNKNNNNNNDNNNNKIKRLFSRWNLGPRLNWISKIWCEVCYL